MTTNSHDFSGRTILLTGASRGIAAAIALALAAAGARLVLHYSSNVDAAGGYGSAIGKLTEQIRALGGAVATVDLDLTQSGAGGEMTRRAIDAFGSIDSAVLSASIQIHKPLLVQDTADIDRQLRINIHANIEALQELLPPMVQSGFGRILSIGSVQESSPSAEMPIYSMCKAALRSLVENVALQTAAFGVTVNNLSPGLVETDRNAFRRVDMESWHRMTAKANPVGRAGQPADMVAPALMLLSREAAFITGATIQATGGAHILHKSNDGIYPQLVLPGGAKPPARS